jgi:cell division protease FtsH
VIAYHEAGHALVAELLPSAVSTHKISIIPRGQALGYTLHLPDEDRYLMSKPELLDQLKVLLGGFVAEQLVFERTTTGAAGDLQRVVKISRAMIEEYGMGSQIFLAGGPGSEALTSQATLHRRDEEQQGLVDHAMFEARMLIMDNRATLDRLAEALLSKETLDRAEIEAIIRPDDSALQGPPAAEQAPTEAAQLVELPLGPVAGNGHGSVGPPDPKPSIAPPANGSVTHDQAEPVQN